jgi:hypothetical protein
MSGRTVSGVISARLQEVAQNAADYDGISMSALVSSALTLWLGLPAAARRTSRHVLTSGTPEAREMLLEECARAIARAGDQALRGRLAARGQAMGLWDTATSEAEIAQEAVDAVRDARRVVSGRIKPERGSARRQSAR